MRLDFLKYHGLGNDYIVIDPREFPFVPKPDAIKAICERNRGAGSDGILLGPLAGAGDLQGFPTIGRLAAEVTPWLRIFNPDGSEAEKSGNGLRIFSLYLAEAGYVGGEEFAVGTLGGVVRSKVESLDPPRIRVDMGEPSFSARDGGLACDAAEFILGELELGGERLPAIFVSMGNPHCVLFVDDPSPELAKRLGPLVENNALFPRRTNVQFAKVLGPHRMRIEIWERGAGYTLSSGSSSCAAAAAARRLGYVSGKVEMQMPGGTLHLDLSFPSIRMTGPAVRIYGGVFSPVMLSILAEAGAISPGIRR
ncbi:MAG: diaminopimelate epimerase [Spirochaetes bacterium]|nr:diaminopimelate epimerase [Spirochaetota bacterium]